MLCIEPYPAVEAECENAVSVRAVVTQVIYGSQATVGDVLVIYDPRHAHFDIDIETLIGSTGTAVYYTMPLESDWGEVTSGCPEYDLYGDCRWVVSSMDCENATKDDIVFRVLSNAPIVRTDVDENSYGLRVWAEVLEVPCNVTEVSHYDRVIVWDLDSEKFDAPVPVLLGAIGTAKYVVDPLPAGDPDCSGECRWVCTGLVCIEELYACNS